jgi:hypothetical protein
MNLETLNAEELYAEIADLAREQGVSSRADWLNLVDEVVGSHLELGELDPDQPLEGCKEDLHQRWETYKQLAGEEAPRDLDEDPEASRG